jgi:hypothetical protein
MLKMYLTKVVENGEDLYLGPIIKAYSTEEAWRIAIKHELTVIGEVPELHYKPRGVSCH